MDWLIWISIAAFVISIWHEVNRFPAANESFRKLQDRMDEIEYENEELKRRLSLLDDDYNDISEKIDRIKNPELWRAIDEKDGFTLYDLENKPKE